MPITISSPIRRLSQGEFGELAYSVLGSVFEIHREFGRLFHEKIYQRELARRHPHVQLEVPVQVWHRSFAKVCYLDALVAGGGLFEFKAVEAIAPRHRAQCLNYLLLAELGHAQLLNVRAEQVEHEFVNTTLRHADRRDFTIVCRDWTACRSLVADRFRDILIGLLRDWGTGLELPLYVDALTHFLGGESQVHRDVVVRMADHTLGVQRMHLAAPGVAFTLTASANAGRGFETHARRLLQHTNLEEILWANIGLKCVSLTSIR